MLEEEIYGESSPIWEADFTMPATEGAPLVARPGMSVFEFHVTVICTRCFLTELLGVSYTRGVKRKACGPDGASRNSFSNPH